MRTRLTPGLLLSFVLAAFVCGCRPSFVRAIHRWSMPEGRHARLQHVMVVAVARSDTVRRSIEEQLHGYLAARGISNAPSYSVQETIAPDAILELARSKGFDGLLVVRLIAKEQEIDSVQWEGYAGRYPGWDEYHPWSWQNRWEPPTLIERIFLFHESKLIAVDNDKLLFSILTKVKAPDSAEKLIRDLVHEVGREAAESGWLEAGKEPQ